jgi:hypothetical protein
MISGTIHAPRKAIAPPGADHRPFAIIDPAEGI